jgi:hypothetical protein
LLSPVASLATLCGKPLIERIPCNNTMHWLSICGTYAKEKQKF